MNDDSIKITVEVRFSTLLTAKLAIAVRLEHLKKDIAAGRYAPEWTENHGKRYVEELQQALTEIRALT